MRVKGKLRVEMKTPHNQRLFLILIVMEGKGPSLRDWLRHVRVGHAIYQMEEAKKGFEVDQVLNEFHEVFTEEPRELRRVKVKIHVDCEARPRFY